MVRILRDDAPLEPFAFVHDSVAAGEILHVFGDVDIQSHRAFEAALQRAIRPDRPLVIDFTSCAYMGAAALSVLIRARATLGHALRVAAPATGTAARVLSIAEMQRCFSIAASPETALAM